LIFIDQTETTVREENKLPEMDFNAMFANNANFNSVKASDEDGVVDIREMLGKNGRSTEADKPSIIIIEKSMENTGHVTELPPAEEFKYIREETTKQKKMLVLDSRAFFLQKISEEALRKDRRNASEDEEIEFSTCADVLREIKDEQTRLYIDSLPFKLESQDPSESALKFVTKFAKETGDYKSLSGTDIRVIALAYSYIQKRGETGY